MWKLAWKDPVWGAVIAAAIIGAIGAIGTFFLGYWPAIGGALGKAYHYLLASSSIPNWTIFALSAFALPTILLLFALTWQAVFPSRPPGPDWAKYTSDSFYGLVWRWRYFGDIMSDMSTFCPNCDFQVFPEQASAYSFIDHISFHCVSCNRNLGSFEESFASLENKAKRFAQQKLRNGSWAGNTAT
jgi:hypothetical protein